MAGIVRVLMGLLSTYGLDVFQIGLICFLFWKLFTNHLAHIAIDITATSKSIKNVKSELRKLRDNVMQIGERVSHVEGRLKQ